MTESTDTEAQKFSTARSKARRITANMFFRKAPKQEESSKDETIERLQDENNKLRKELNNSNSRIRELESEARVIQPRQYEILPSPTLTSVPSARESFEHRDDDGGVDDGGEDNDDDSECFGVEVEADAVESAIKQQELLDNEDDAHSITSSACTIPTGNDKKSKFHRRHNQLRQRLRRSSGSSSNNYSSRRPEEDVHLNYFSRPSPSLDSIIEITTRRSLFDDCDSEDDIASATSDLTASFSSIVEDDDSSSNRSSLMSGRKLPLFAMKSLLRISSAESDSIRFVPDDENVLFGEI